MKETVEKSEKGGLDESELLKAKIQENINILNHAEDMEEKKKIVCAFYQGGEHPGCKGCRQSDEKVEECAEVYVSRAEVRPMNVWTPEFDRVEVRQKISLAEIQDEITLQCDTCYMADKCPLQKARSTCAIDWGKQSNKVDAKQIYDYLIGVQRKRVARASVFEEMDGGVPDANLSTEMDRLASLVTEKNELDTIRISASVEAKGTGSGGSLLQSIFGGAINGQSNQTALPEKSAIIEDIEFSEEALEPEKAKKVKSKKDEK